METRLKYKKRHNFFWFVLALVMVQACSSTTKTKQVDLSGGAPPPTEVMGPPEPYGPPVAITPAVPQPAYGPDPIQTRPVVLIFGAGMARGFAYAGVLRALQDAKVPIGAILGTGMGALIAALYVNSSSINQFEWALLKIKEDLFIQHGFLGNEVGKPTDGEKLSSTLKQIFGDKQFGASTIPIKFLGQTTPNGAPVIIEHGSILKGLRSALAFTKGSVPGAFETSQIFLVQEAKRMGIGSVIAVNIGSSNTHALGVDEQSRVDLEIKPNLTGINDSDFGKKTEAAFRGKSAVIQQLAEIRHQVGG